ncbi:MAG: bifunctional folylpolyglutamate synthase/dihydrofolate synthase [Euryarchaeota archaeon]|nr:bifunctional folylpolyglutamate synthase/dihydrofolate synthase [Euryarchaeota archaeon]
MNEKETLEWIFSFEKHGMRLGLERITSLLNTLGNPQDTLNVIHVAGTNGKGSVCNYISSILQKAGYRVGVYLSPHLQRFSERIIINNKEISSHDLITLVERIRPLVEEMQKQNQTPTFFEIVTAIAFRYFKEQKVDYTVVEVGLGGRLDATNVVSPLVCVITDISLEHTEILGKSIKKIAFEKAGIIKNNIPVVTAAKQDAQTVIQTIAKEKNSSLIIIEKSQIKRLTSTMTSQEFSINGHFKEYIVKTSLLGEFQGENIALSIAAIEMLQMNGVYITDADIADGISAAFNPGRMEIISEKPMILLDGAHNPSGMKMLAISLKKDFTYNQLILVLGIFKDKDIKTMLSTIIPLADIMIATKSTSSRAFEPTTLVTLIKDQGFKKPVHIEPSLTQAIKTAKKLAKKDDIICITGSLFTVGEARSYLLPLIFNKKSTTIELKKDTIKTNN